MKLKKIIKDLEIKTIKGSREIEIEAVTSNSKLASPGCLFIAKRGKKFDGNDYIQDAVLAGAVCILTDIFNPFIENVAQIVVEDVAKSEVIVAKEFFGDPTESLFTVGITGTNGKTTTSYLVRHLLNSVESVGLIGTIERIVGEFSYASDLTMPDCITTLKLLKDMLTCGQTGAVLEVCSHGLHQNRADGLAFDVACLTNLTPEHLDYHQTMEEYFAQKAKLFTKLKPEGAMVINSDDPYGQRLIKMVKSQPQKLLTYGIDNKSDFYATQISLKQEGSSFLLNHSEGKEKVEVGLIGKYNLYNVLCAIAVARFRKVPMRLILERLNTFPQINGRMERVDLGDEKTAYVDFAHTEDSLRNALSTLREITKGKLFAVWGCGGDRDRQKRPKMAAVSEQWADYTIVTTCNPRTEDPEAIAKEICTGFQRDHFEVILDRREAIKTAIEKMQQGDVVLIAGKGHEKKQLFLGKSIDFDDISVAKEFSNCLSCQQLEASHQRRTF